MRLLRILRQRARSLVRGAKADAGLARELAFHLEQLTRENIAGGMEPAAARLAARRTMGGLTQIEEECRDHRRIRWLTDLRKDFAFAWRTLARSPGFTLLAVVTLALGVGASMAVYALSEALLLRSLPYPEPERLVRIAAVHRQNDGGFVSQANFLDWQAHNTVFERMALTASLHVTLTGDGEAEQIEGRSVSEGFFELLGVQPRLGRWFTSEEQKPGGACVVIASHGFWMRRLGGRPEAVGGAIVMNDRPCRIAGIMPESFRFNESGRGVAEYWTPVRLVTPDYFRTMGIELRAGRTFTARDTAGAEPVTIVNEAFVRKLLPGRMPVGARVRIGSVPWARIVGVVGDVRHFGPAQQQPAAEAYVPYTMAPYLQFVSIHTAVPEQGVLREVRGIIRELDQGLPMTQVRTMRQSVDQSISPVRQMTTLVAGFGLVTLVMAAIGLSGTMLYMVCRRRREIGLRIALGALPGDISRGVFGSAARLVAVGSAIGVLAALASGRVLESLLHGVRWYDPAAMAAAPAALAAIALTACLLPSRRAAAVEPTLALRQE